MPNCTNICLFDHSPHLSKEWDFDKNDINPKEVTYGSTRKIWWLCPKNHSYRATPNSRTSHRSGCAYCSGQKVLSGFNDLQTTDPAIASELVDSVYKSTEISRSSGKQVKWSCDRGHVWTAAPYTRIKGHGCPYCAGTKAIPGKTDLKTLFPLIASELVDINLDASTLPAYGRAKLEWKCNSGHVWISTTNNRVKGNGCPKCSLRATSRAEKTLRDLLREHYSTSLDHTHRVTVDREKYNSISVDIEIFGLNIPVIVEYDCWYFHRDKIEKDTAKTQLLLNNGYAVIRVREYYKSQSLDYLPITHPNLLQLTTVYPDKDYERLVSAVKRIKTWIEEKNRDG